MERPVLAEDKSPAGNQVKGEKGEIHPGVGLEPERYVLNRYLNAKGRLSVKQVADEISNYYGLPEGVAKGVIRNPGAGIYGKA